MHVEETRLANGLTIVSHRMAQVGTVAIGLWVATGARHESGREHGLSHLIEHMAFKGTRRRTARGIVEEIEQVGGELNAATSLDQTAFYARVLKSDWPAALEILADILLNPVYEPSDLEREREVILQEIAATRDSPDDIILDLVQDAAFPGQPLGRSILGTTRSVKAFTAEDLHSFRDSRYHPADIVLSAAGGIGHDQLARHAEALFGALRPRERIMPDVARYEGGSRLSTRKFEQVHVVMGYRSPSYRDDGFYEAQVLSGLLGGGMSSRLFQEVREKRGLCYSIYASAWGLADAGMFSVHSATSLDSIGELVDVVADELERVANEAPRPKEVDRAKALLKAGLLMSLESPMARAEQMARQKQALGRLVSTEELIEKVEGVARKDLRQLAEWLQSGGRPSFAVVGAGKSGLGVIERMEERAALSRTARSGAGKATKAAW